MGQIHDILEAKGKRAAIEANAAPRDVLEAAALYMADEDNALSFAYSGWAQCALPHKRLPPGQPWEVASDRMRLVVEPGRRPTTQDGPLEWTSVPFGSHSRLILLWFQQEALRTGSPEVELGRSYRDWMQRMGVPWGGNSGRSVREQAELISRCRLTFHLFGAGREGLVNQSIMEGALMIDSPGDERQGRLNLEAARLSHGFFEQLKKHPVPLEESAIRALANNSPAIDCYLWLAYRLHSLSAPKLVTWKALKAQHGVSFKHQHHFKARFPHILHLATAVYPAAKVDIIDEGVILKPSRPPVAPKLIAIPTR
ncbi:replication protein RepA [Belnapia rosea]|uniref:replication protein RepA n=1 Tax=Belnapia rosea TaxID=938405 RepID=UPI0008849DAD|nr:replication protein RepA [Belnapia rosea]SDB74442.1 RepA protein [Belnapia rosea]